jgi:hypothetical protein
MANPFQEQLHPYSFDEIRELLIDLGEQHDDLHTNVVYLGYMCSRGVINDVSEFLETHHEVINGDSIHDILNFKSPLFYYGTVLHEALYWNKDQIGLDLFDMLVSHGAQFKRNHYNEFPWQQYGLNWSALHGDVIGVRNPDEFVSFYEELIETYQLHNVVEGLDATG